jgi:hypothetical protein
MKFDDVSGHRVQRGCRERGIGTHRGFGLAEGHPETFGNQTLSDLHLVVLRPRRLIDRHPLSTSTVGRGVRAMDNTRHGENPRATSRKSIEQLTAGACMVSPR